MNRPMATTTTATSRLARVTGTLYMICCPGMVKPSMAMKCMVQMPVAPMATDASSSQMARVRPA